MRIVRLARASERGGGGELDIGVVAEKKRIKTEGFEDGFDGAFEVEIQRKRAA